MLYWNIDWKTSQQSEDAIRKQIITKLFVNNSKQIFLFSK